LHQVRIDVGIHDVQDIESNAQQERQIAVSLVKPLRGDQSVVVEILKLVVVVTRKPSFVGIAILVVFFIIVKIEIQTGSDGTVNNRDFPVFFVVRLAQTRQNRRIESRA